MIIHFIWFGSAPHPDLIKKVARKMRYLKVMFADASNLHFYLWTTSDLKGSLNKGFASQEDLMGGWHLDIQTKDINELFRPSSPYLSFDDTCSLKDIFIKESLGPLSKPALAADMLKMLILLHFGGLFMDAGLEIDHTAISHELKTRGQNLLKKFTQFHLAFSYTVAPNRSKNPFDLQIMYSQNTPQAKSFFGEVITKILYRFKDSPTYWDRFKNSPTYQTTRKKRFGGQIIFKFSFKGQIYEVPKPGEVEAYTGVEFISAAINLDKSCNGMIYKFIIMYKDSDQDVFPTLFSDFPGIYRKLTNPNYPNWRDCYYTTRNAQYDTYNSTKPYTIPPKIYKMVTDFFKDKNNKAEIENTNRDPERIYVLHEKNG